MPGGLLRLSMVVLQDSVNVKRRQGPVYQESCWRDRMPFSVNILHPAYQALLTGDCDLPSRWWDHHWGEYFEQLYQVDPPVLQSLCWIHSSERKHLPQLKLGRQSAC